MYAYEARPCIASECAGDEAWNYIEMLNTGHAVNYNNSRERLLFIIWTLAGLVKQSEVGKTLEYDFILKTIKTSIDVVCSLNTHIN
ncbi:CpaF/VirB11 family protein [Vibrio campbellii]|uniref:CpaF/VirB11 family protein n=1 Tax=Vibrio campbellii TaxID=680 RepID=UPI0020B13F53|nr:CpaF/VirB11 family protein [Vibrio campbellii]